MNALEQLRGSRRGVNAEDLRVHSQSLAAAVAAGGDQLDPALTERARAVATKVEQRLARSGSHTVVAFAGATGSGKSSLFNAVVGADVAAIGARRPTTSKPTAAIWGADPAGELLDWLEVPSRHSVGEREETLDGLVLLDLPDFDSREVGNRAEAERILGLADVFVWVTDPQKYADARLHDDYVAAMTGYDAVTIVVLNQSDRLTGQQLAQCVADLERLLRRDGRGGVQVLATSARTGNGVDQLRARLAKAVDGARAARTRLDADVRGAATALRDQVGSGEPDLAGSHRDALVTALARSAGVPTVLDAVRRDYQRDAVAATGWPFTRWVRRLRPDPLRRLRLDPADRVALGGGDAARSLRRSSLPTATPAARAGVELAARRLADGASTGLPHRWADAVHAAAEPTSDRLADELDQAVVATQLTGRRPLWWTLLGALQILLAAAVVVGLLWTLVEVFFGAQDLIELPMPHVGPFGLPLILLVGGLLLGWILALLSRWFAAVGGGRRATRARGRLDKAIGQVADRVIVDPISAVLTRHRETRAHLDRAGASRR